MKKLPPGMKKIPLTQGKFAIVSAKDYDFLMQWKWRAQIRSDGKGWYAVREEYMGMENGKRKRKTVSMHRAILTRKLGHENFKEADHLDGNGLHNFRSNLRPTSRKQNEENRKRLNKNNTTGIRGVSWHKAAGKWNARICHNGKNKHLGLFNNIEEAEKAVIAGRNKYFTHHQD